MKTRFPDSTPFLTEGERRIAEQVKKMRDLQAHDHVVGGGFGQQKFSRASINRSEVKDSHDRY